MTSHINRTNFDKFWLEYSPHPKPHPDFKKLILKEKEESRDLIKDALSKAILHHHTEPEEIEFCVSELGFTSLASRLPPETVLTKDGKEIKNTTRIGNFGEVVAAEHLCQHHDNIMPVFKLRYSPSLVIALPGEDVIVFKISKEGIINAICLCEAKTMKRYAGAKVKEAHGRLNKAYKADPVTLNFISRILIKENKNLSRQIMRIVGSFGLKDFPTENWIFIITGNEPRDPFEQISKLTNIIENLNVVSLHLQNLPDFIDEVFYLASRCP